MEEKLEHRNVFTNEHTEEQQCAFCGENIQRDNLLQWIHIDTQRVLCQTKATPANLRRQR